MTNFDAFFFYTIAKNDKSDMGEFFFFEKEQNWGLFFQKNSLLVVSITSVGRIQNKDILPADIIETTKSMFAAQENIMILFAFIYVRACMYAYLKIFHRGLINDVR